MYNIADDFWDSYFRHKKEMRSLRRETSNTNDSHGSTSVDAKGVPSRRSHVEKTGRNNSFQKQNDSDE